MIHFSQSSQVSLNNNKHWNIVNNLLVTSHSNVSINVYPTISKPIKLGVGTQRLQWLPQIAIIPNPVWFSNPPSWDYQWTWFFPSDKSQSQNSVNIPYNEIIPCGGFLIWEYPQIIHFRSGFSITNHPFWRSTIYGNPKNHQIMSSTLTYHPFNCTWFYPIILGIGYNHHII